MNSSAISLLSAIAASMTTTAPAKAGFRLVGVMPALADARVFAGRIALSGNLIASAAASLTPASTPQLHVPLPDGDPNHNSQSLQFEQISDGWPNCTEPQSCQRLTTRTSERCPRQKLLRSCEAKQPTIRTIGLALRLPGAEAQTRPPWERIE